MKGLRENEAKLKSEWCKYVTVVLREESQNSILTKICDFQEILEIWDTWH